MKEGCSMRISERLRFSLALPTFKTTLSDSFHWLIELYLPPQEKING